MSDVNEDGLDSYFMPLLRKKFGFTQAVMARHLGLSLRAYQDLETRATPLRKLHLMAMRLVSLEEAVLRGDRGMATITMANLANKFSELPISDVDEKLSRLSQYASSTPEDDAVAMGQRMFGECRTRGLLKMKRFNAVALPFGTRHLPSYQGRNPVVIDLNMHDWDFGSPRHE